MEPLNSMEHTLNAIRGQFSPDQFSALLNMYESEIAENYLVWFHERFHYLQSIFTPYGHLKWGCFRSYTADVLQAWLGISEKFNCKKKVPIASYLDDENVNALKIVATIHLQDIVQQFTNISEYAYLSKDIVQITQLDQDNVVPVISLNGNDYNLNGIDILESYAKFEEALLGYLCEEKPLTETINPDILPERYYSALDYFLSNVGSKRLHEFPIVCELSLAITNLPKYNDMDAFKKSHPSWRFISIVNCLKENKDIPSPDIFSNEAFFSYANRVLTECNFDTFNNVWKSAEDYANQADLSMAKEMIDAIKYKKNNPWMLSFPMRNPQEFFSKEFNRFQPIFTITYDTVYYNLDNISSLELIFENHFQALALQICGRMSSRCIYPDMLQCGFSYFGLKNCPYQINGQCDGHIDGKSILAPLELDDEENIIGGCTFEVVLNIMGTSIREIDICNVNEKISLEEISSAIKKHNMG